MIAYTIMLSFFGNHFALAHSGYITSYQIGQAGCTFERNLNSKSALGTFLQNIYLRFFFSILWLLLLFFVFKINIYFICFIGFFTSFIYLIFFDQHTKFIEKSSLLLSFVPLLTIITVSLLFYFFPHDLTSLKTIQNKIDISYIFLIFIAIILMAIVINRNNKYFIFEILYSSIPIFILNLFLENQINEQTTFYIIIFYKILEFIYAGCYFVLTGTKKMSKIIHSFCLLKKYYSIFLFILCPIIIVLLDNNHVSIIVIFWIFLFRLTSFLLLSYKILVSSIYIVYSILLIYFSTHINDFLFISLLISPNIIFFIFQHKINFSNFTNLKTSKKKVNLQKKIYIKK